MIVLSDLKEPQELAREIFEFRNGRIKLNWNSLRLFTSKFGNLIDYDDQSNSTVHSTASSHLSSSFENKTTQEPSLPNTDNENEEIKHFSGSQQEFSVRNDNTSIETTEEPSLLNSEMNTTFTVMNNATCTEESELLQEFRALDDVTFFEITQEPSLPNSGIHTTIRNATKTDRSRRRSNQRSLEQEISIVHAVMKGNRKYMSEPRRNHSPRSEQEASYESHRLLELEPGVRESEIASSRNLSTHNAECTTATKNVDTSECKRRKRETSNIQATNCSIKKKIKKEKCPIQDCPRKCFAREMIRHLREIHNNRS